MGMHSTAAPVINMPNNLLGQLGLFGSGQFQVFLASGLFKVPPGVSRIRVRLVGGGGPGFGSIAGQSTAVNGGTTSFGGLLSATGGGGGPSSGTAAGGSGNGGDFQASGGNASNGGGAGAGSQLGRGGSSVTRSGAGVGGGDTVSASSAPQGNKGDYFGGSPFGLPRPEQISGAPNAQGDNKSSNPSRPLNPAGALMRFPFDCFYGAGGDVNYTSTNQPGEPGGVGAGAAYGTATTIFPNGGIGGGSAQMGTSNPPQSGVGGIGGGGAGAGSLGNGGGAGAGYAHGIFDVTENASLMATVAAAIGNGGPGLCVVEW